ncbi:MAG: hypothetical protein WBQ73_00525, partial [Candidatus Babeliales bacterium]
IPPIPANLYLVKEMKKTSMPSLTFIVEKHGNIVVRLPLDMIKLFKLNFYTCIHPWINTIDKEKERQSPDKIQLLVEGYCRNIVTSNAIDFPLDYSYFVQNFLIKWMGPVDTNKCDALRSQIEKLPTYSSEGSPQQRKRLLRALGRGSSYF